MPIKTCKACSYSYMEPDSPYLICGHTDAGPLGQFIRKEPLDHCPDFAKFEQHSLRNIDGTLPSAHNTNMVPKEFHNAKKYHLDIVEDPRQDIFQRILALVDLYFLFQQDVYNQSSCIRLIRTLIHKHKEG